jgi:hypothetical protein
MPLLRSALWLHHASALWDISHTAYYLAIINAVESLTQDINQGDPCPECGLRRGGGPTGKNGTGAGTLWSSCRPRF